MPVLHKRLKKYGANLIKDVNACMKIFLDDTRDKPSNTFNCASTYEQCIELISVFSKDIEFIDLDYNLGRNSEYSGLDVLVYMHEHEIQPAHINIHSSHERGSHEMMKYAKRCFPNSIVTSNKTHK